MSSSDPVVPGFALEKLLGEGSYGRVFLAREREGLARLVALKVFPKEQRAAFDAELAAVRTIEEIRRRERSAELVQALGSGATDDLSWIALEYLEQGSLADVIARDGPLDLARGLAAARETARAVRLLHRSGIYHRDIKPQNLLLGSDGHVRLGDFGLSRSLDGTLSAAGSPAFAAPEVIAGKPVSGELADVYSLGATIIYLLTAETILPGCPDLFALERCHVPRDLQQALAAATVASPKERTKTAQTLLETLDLEFEKISRSKSDARDVSLERRESPMVEVTTPAPAARKRGSRAIYFVIVALILGVLMVPVGLFVVAVLFLTARVDTQRERVSARVVAEREARDRAEKRPPATIVPSAAPVEVSPTLTPEAPLWRLSLPQPKANEPLTGETDRVVFVPFEYSEPGDWSVYVSRRSLPDDDVLLMPKTEVRTTLYTVKEIRDRDERHFKGATIVLDVREQIRVRAERRSTERTLTVNTNLEKGLPCVADFLGVTDPFVVKERSAGTRKAVVLGSGTFPCTEHSFVADEGARGSAKVTIESIDNHSGGISVRGLGLVRLEREGRVGGQHVSETRQLAGYGSRIGVHWGQTFEEVAKDDSLSSTRTDQTALPVNDLADAKAGDWAFYEGHYIVFGKETRLEDRELRTVESADGSTTKISWFRTRDLDDVIKKNAVEHHLSFATKEGPKLTLAILLTPGAEGDSLDGFRVTKHGVSDASYEAGGETFACQKATFTVSNDHQMWKLSIWQSPRVKAGGIVAIEARSWVLPGDGKDWDQGYRVVLSGHGSLGKTEWGHAPGKR